MRNKIIAYDLATGGIKASLYNAEGYALASAFEAYDTFYDGVIHEQMPNDWWKAIIRTTQLLMKQTETPANSIAALSISGHSLGAIPLDKNGNLLRTATPIWSDKRATQQCSEFFEKVDYKQWYETTGNGFPPECYTLFKVMWYRTNEPELFYKIQKIVGTKDYCNYMLTLDVLLQEKHNVHQMLIVGGGAKSNVWMQIFADIYQLNIEKTSIDQEAASLGAAALALKGIRLWKDYSPIDLLHKSVNTFTPNHDTQQLYDQLLQQFKSLDHYIAKPLHKES